MRAPLNRYYLEKIVFMGGFRQRVRLSESLAWDPNPPNPMGFSNVAKASRKAIELGVEKSCYIAGRQGGKYKVNIPMAQQVKEKRYAARGKKSGGE